MDNKGKAKEQAMGTQSTVSGECDSKFSGVRDVLSGLLSSGAEVH